MPWNPHDPRDGAEDPAQHRLQRFRKPGREPVDPAERAVDERDECDE